MTDDHDDLSDLFAAARDEAAPSDALIARVMADAAAVQAEGPVAEAVPGRGRIGAWLSNIGGWRGAGGLAAAAVTGLMIGVYAPGSIDTLLSGQLSDRGLIESDILASTWGDLLELEDG